MTDPAAMAINELPWRQFPQRLNESIDAVREFSEEWNTREVESALLGLQIDVVRTLYVVRFQCSLYPSENATGVFIGSIVLIRASNERPQLSDS